MRLSELKTGEKGVIVKVLGHGGFRKRIVEMGFIKGKTVEVLLNAPLKDPIKYKVMGYEISLRRQEAGMIEILSEHEAKEQVTKPNYHPGMSEDIYPGEEELKRIALGKRRTINVALVGNPNCGKTSLFNIASGSHEHVGNYSGVTVDAKEGYFNFQGYHFRIVDLPGTYSLSAYSPEEMYVRHHIIDETPDIVINVVDSSNLERNLYLTTQLIDMNVRMVMALNMYDELEASGNTLDYMKLSELFGVPMVPTVSRTGKGIEDLFHVVISIYEGADFLDQKGKVRAEVLNDLREWHREYVPGYTGGAHKEEEVRHHGFYRHIHINHGPELERSIEEVKRHNGTNHGCEKKSAVTSDNSKPYLISEYNGHMYPTKSYDWEEHRVWHAMRHVNVLDAVAGEADIAGSFGWCMFDYNTHKDFGSGDRICYHGVMDMFRNPKLAAAVYTCQQEKEPVLEISSSMDIGEHPGCNRGTIWIFTNADSVRMYKNDRFLKEYTASDSPYKNLSHGPIAVDDFIGDAIEKEEDFKPEQARKVKYILNAAARYGLSNLPKGVYLAALKLILMYHMKPTDAVALYNRYIGDWGGTSTSYRFEAVKNGKVVKVVRKEPVTSMHLSAEPDHQNLTERNTYEAAEIRIRALDQNDNIVSFYQEPVVLSTEGPIAIIGPEIISLQGGMGGTYVRTTGEEGVGILKIKAAQMEEQRILFEVKNDRK